MDQQQLVLRRRVEKEVVQNGFLMHEQQGGTRAALYWPLHPSISTTAYTAFLCCTLKECPIALAGSWTSPWPWRPSRVSSINSQRP